MIAFSSSLQWFVTQYSFSSSAGVGFPLMMVFFLERCISSYLCVGTGFFRSTNGTFYNSRALHGARGLGRETRRYREFFGKWRVAGLDFGGCFYRMAGRNFALNCCVLGFFVATFVI